MDLSDDMLLGGRVRIRQAPEGYRAGMDAALLAASCDAPARSRVLEAGCGVGAALLAAAVRLPTVSFVGIERDPAALALACANIALNGLQNRVSAVAGDVDASFNALQTAPFDAVLANPPYFDDAGALRGPHAAKRDAWIADGGLGAWIAFLTKATRRGRDHHPDPPRRPPRRHPGAVVTQGRFYPDQTDSALRGYTIQACARQGGEDRASALEASAAPGPPRTRRGQAHARGRSDSARRGGAELALSGSRLSSWRDRRACSWRSRASWPAGGRRPLRSDVRRRGGAWP